MNKVIKTGVLVLLGAAIGYGVYLTGEFEDKTLYYLLLGCLGFFAVKGFSQ